MSRIGNKPVILPQEVTAAISKDNLLTVKGPKGILSQQIGRGISLKQENDQLLFSRTTEQNRHKALHGLYRVLANNMVVGVTQGYRKELELVGVGYKAATKGNFLELNLGYSHSIYFQVPNELSVSTSISKSKNPIIILEGIDKQLIGYVAAEIRKLRKVEPYKGKGIRFVGEQIRRKAGKAKASKK